MTMPKVNRNYKDRLFRKIFNQKDKLLSLYNAMRGSNYSDPEKLEITTLDDAVYMSMKNDVSFLVDNILNLYEHQSTYNPNMPIRGLLYLSELYRSYIDNHKLNLYGQRKVFLPRPQYIVFYNGHADEPDRMELKLSDTFLSPGGDSCLIFTAVMLNINWGHNKELLEQCEDLNGYSQFIFRIRTALENGSTLEEAAEAAISSCIQDKLLANFLSTHRAEVYRMILTEYDEQSHIASEREDARSMELAELILDQLEEYGSVPNDLAIIITNLTNLSTLRNWLKVAVKCSSAEEFKTTIFGSNEITDEELRKYGILLNSLSAQNYILKKREDARAKDIAEGMVAGLSEVLLELLETASPIPDELKQIITSQTNPDTLRQWIRIAAASSAQEFQQRISI